MSDELREFSHDTDAAIRLYLEHWIFKHDVGFLLHPHIAVTDSPDLKILDIGCGTGLWLSDSANSFPQAQLHGIDLTAAHIPYSIELAKNIRLWQQDACKLMPAELLGQYDVVHVARFHMYIGDESLDLVAQNFNALLKPNGWLQWDELDAPGTHVARYLPPGKRYPAFEQLHARFNAWLKTQKSTSSTLEDLPDLLSNHGFTVNDFKRCEISPSMAKPWTDMQLIAMRDYSENVLIPDMQKAGAGQDAVDEAPMNRAEVAREVAEKGLRILMDQFFLVAQKSAVASGDAKE